MSQSAFERLGFVRNPLSRHSAERDHDLVARHLADAGALTIAIAGEIPILRRNGAGMTAVSSAGFRRDCAACGTQHFPRTDPVAIMLVHRGEHCLLGRQARFIANSYSCLAGFIEPGETIEDAVRRETFEEAGIEVGAVRYGASQPWPFPSSLMIGCFGEALTEAITLDRDELEDGRWFAKDEVRLMLAREHPEGLITPPPMAIAHFLMRSWVEGAAAG